MKFYSYAVALTLAAGITFSGLKPAYGELVFEDDLNSAQSESQETSPVQKRLMEKQEVSKSEAMRRQRLREELKNEDMLTQKLEELRLRDEMKRTDSLLGSGVQKDAPEALEEQRVGSAQVVPATDAVQQVPTSVAINGAPVDGAVMNQSVVEAEMPAEKKEEETRVSITPKFGLASITNSIYDVNARFSAGLGIGMDITDHIGFQAGYSYSSYSLGAGQSVMMPMGFASSNLQTVNFNDNVIEAGIRGYFLGTKSKLRPFVGAGGAYRRGFVNYDDRTQKFLRQYNQFAAQDIEISGFAGYVETGLEFKLTKAIALTGSFKFFNVFASRQSNPLDPNAFLNQSGMGYYGYSGSLMPGYAGALGAAPGYGLGYNNDTRAQAGDALARNNFYQLTVGVSVSF